MGYFLKFAIPDLFFVYFRHFSIFLHNKNYRTSENRTRIVEVEGEHTHHLTTTTPAQKGIFNAAIPIIKRFISRGQSRPLFQFSFVFAKCNKRTEL